MLTLAIETSNPSAWSPESRFRPGVALRWADGRGEREAVAIDTPHYDDLAGAIARLVERAGIRPSDIKRVAVSIGPGGYTATRLGVATARMIAEATGAECIGVPTAHVVAARARLEGRGFAVALASKGETTWVTRFSPEGRATDSGALLEAGGVVGTGIGVLLADKYLPGAVREACTRAGVPIVSPEFDPLACAEVGAAFAAVDPAQLVPMYPREPEAVTKWRLLHGAPRS